MFLLPTVMLLLLFMAVALPWRVLRQRRFVPLFLVLAAVSGIVLWFSWTRDLTYTVSGYVNGQLAGSYEEDFRTGFKVFVTCELAVILSAAITLVAGATTQPRSRSRTP